ncbi:MAG: hypothetical protein ACOWWH_08845 [Eubacteriaceae bacterium]
MRHKLKILIFFIFIMSVLYYGVREINYNNYQIINGDTKEVIYFNFLDKKTEVYVFGETILVDDELNNYINSIISKFKK